MNLYEINEAMLELEASLENEEITEQTLKDTMESIGGTIYDKTENIIKFIRNLEAEKKALKDEATHMNVRATQAGNKITSLKDYLKGFMQYSEMSKIGAGIFKATLVKSPPRLIVNSEDNIPKSYYIEQAPKLNNASLKADVKNGVEIKGVELQQGVSLRIK